MATKEAIIKSITGLAERGGSSLAAIKKALIAEGWDFEAGPQKSQLLKGLKTGVEKGYLIQNKGSYKVAIKAKKVKAPVVFTRVNPKGEYLTKSELTNNFCAETGLTRKQATGVFVAMGNIGLGELKKGRKFVMPGLARFVVRNKPATKARKGINPFTKEPCVFKAKPARQVVKAYVVKAFKDLK